MCMIIISDDFGEKSTVWWKKGDEIDVGHVPIKRLLTVTHLASVFKFIHFGERFRKVPFSVIENAVLVWTEGLSG